MIDPIVPHFREYFELILAEMHDPEVDCWHYIIKQPLGDVKEDYWLGTEQFRDFLLTMFDEEVVNPIFEREL